MGRKAISGTPKTETPLRIRLTVEERALLDAAADSVGVPTSTWVRDLAIKHATLRTRKKAAGDSRP